MITGPKQQAGLNVKAQVMRLDGPGGDGRKEWGCVSKEKRIAKGQVR